MKLSDPEKIKAIISELLEIANKFMLADRGRERLGITLQDMLDLCVKYCQEGMWLQAEQICEMGRGVTSLTHEYHGAEMDTSFALGAVHYYYATALVGQGDISKALKYFELSCNAFKLSANYTMAAAAVWLGVAELESHQQNYNETLWALQRSRNLIQARPGHIAEELRRRIEREQTDARNRLDQSLRTANLKPDVPSNKPHQTRTLNLRVIPIHSNLAAGSGIWHSDDPYIENYAEWQRLWIDSHPYVVVPLTGTVQVTLTEQYEYGLSRVKGKSMDKRGIGDGDYVLYRRQRGHPPQPEHGDIVAVALDDGNARLGVVKRYHQQRGEPAYLESESTDPDEKDIPLDGKHPECIGTVIAVLKDAEQTENE